VVYGTYGIASPALDPYRRESWSVKSLPQEMRQLASSGLDACTGSVKRTTTQRLGAPDADVVPPFSGGLHCGMAENWRLIQNGAYGFAGRTANSTAIYPDKPDIPVSRARKNSAGVSVSRLLIRR
jgi:hypothetical protein